MNMKFVLALSAAIVAGGLFADSTEGGNRPRGIRLFGDNLTLLPYVNLAYTYDSNVDQMKKAAKDSIFLITPGLDLNYDDKNGFKADAKVWYTYNHYCKYNSINKNSYGESVSLKKDTSAANEKGWTLLFQEQYSFIGQNDSFSKTDGRGIWRDREIIGANAAIERRFTERLHATISGSYDYLDYDNDDKKYGYLYGWTRYSVGGEIGLGITEMTDLLISGGYSKYQNHKKDDGNRKFSNDSQSYSIMGGVASRIDRQITYRALVGGSWFEYGDSYDTTGWTYQLSGRWMINDRWSASILGASHYQPSEYTLGSATKVYSISAGVRYRMTDRLDWTFDAAYRKDNRVYTSRSITDRDEDYAAFRLGATWWMNRYASLYARAEYEFCDYDNDNAYSYDRFRGTIGVQLHY